MGCPLAWSVVPGQSWSQFVAYPTQQADLVCRSWLVLDIAAAVALAEVSRTRGRAAALPGR